MQQPTWAQRDRGGKRWKVKPRAVPGPWKESCLYWRSPLPCILLPRALASLEKAGMRGRLTFRWGVHGSWSCCKNARGHKDPIYTEAQTSMQVAHIHACTLFLHLPHCSVSQDGFLAVIHSRDSLFPEWVTHTRACKAQLIDLLDFRGWGRWDIRCSLEISSWDHSGRAKGLLWEQQGRNSTLFAPTDNRTKVFFF